MIEASWVGNPPEEKEETEVAFHCECCRYPIYIGDTFYDIHGDRICEECIDEYIRDYKEVARA